MGGDCRGPSSSSTIRSVGLLTATGGVSEMVSKRESEGVAIECIGSIGQRALRHDAGGAVSVLVGERPTHAADLLAAANGKDVAVGIGNCGAKAVIRNGFLAV